MKARFEMRVPFTTRLDLDHEHGAKFTVQLLAWWKSMVEIVEVVVASLHVRVVSRGLGT